MAASQLSKVVQHIRSLVRRQDAEGMTDGHLLELFISRRDEAAFEALFRRHGPMVLSVCQRVLRNANDAEDAFQATFLVLVRKAGSIRRRGTLASWLYGVAHRTALEARRAAARRRAKERQVRELLRSETEDDKPQELRPVLDQELERLPEKYRVAVVLCDLEGKTRKEAAELLGWGEGTVASRLARARKLLAKRLTRRGLALSAGALASALCEQAASARVPTPLQVSTIKAACLVAAGKTAPGVISAEVAALTEGVLKTMLLSKWKAALAVLLVLAVAGYGLSLAGSNPQAPDPAEPPKRAGPERVVKSITFRGAAFDDTSDMLHIQKQSVQVALNGDYTHCWVTIDLYRDAMKVPWPSQTIPPLRLENRSQQRKDRVDFCIQVADLDYLPLGGGKKGHCRVLLKLAMRGTGTTLVDDHPKQIFDFSKLSGQQAFGVEASSGEEVPLFWLIGNTNNMVGANTVKQVLERNPKGDLVIFTLHVKKD